MLTRLWKVTQTVLAGALVLAVLGAAAAAVWAHAQMQRPDLDGARLAVRMKASAFLCPDPVSGLEQFRVLFQPPDESCRSRIIRTAS